MVTARSMCLHTASSMCEHMKSMIELGVGVCNCREVGVGVCICDYDCINTYHTSLTIHALFVSHALDVVVVAVLVYRLCCLVREVGLSQRGISRGVSLCLLVLGMRVEADVYLLAYLLTSSSERTWLS
jgi:hypothetical protein